MVIIKRSLSKHDECDQWTLDSGATCHMRHYSVAFNLCKLQIVVLAIGDGHKYFKTGLLLSQTSKLEANNDQKTWRSDSLLHK